MTWCWYIIVGEEERSKGPFVLNLSGPLTVDSIKPFGRASKGPTRSPIADQWANSVHDIKVADLIQCGLFTFLPLHSSLTTASLASASLFPQLLKQEPTCHSIFTGVWRPTPAPPPSTLHSWATSPIGKLIFSLCAIVLLSQIIIEMIFLLREIEMDYLWNGDWHLHLNHSHQILWTWNQFSVKNMNSDEHCVLHLKSKIVVL